MYHSIASDGNVSVHPYYRTVTTPEIFERQMDFLNQSGYQALTLSEAVGLLQLASDTPAPHEISNPLPLGRAERGGRSRRVRETTPRPVVVTFDDGFRDFHTEAFPILEKFGFKATVFLTSGCIDKTFITGRPCLAAREIRELAGKGVEFGSHTVSHPQLQGLSRNKIVHELAGSKSSIEDIIGSLVSSFSYPYRFPEEDKEFTKNFGAVLLEQGYAAGVTTVIGLSKPDDPLLFLKRLPVNDCDDSQLLRAKLEGDYDWMHTGQLTYKKLRAKCMSLTRP